MRVRHAGRVFAAQTAAQATNELQYRANLVIQIAQSVLSMGGAIIAVLLVLRQTGELNGWGRDDLLTLVAVFVLVGGFVSMYVRPNLMLLVQDVRTGMLDYVLMRPVNTGLYVTTRAVRLWSVVDCFAGAALLGIAVFRQRDRTGLLDLGMFALALALGVCIIYCFLLVLMLTSVWLVRTEEIAELFGSLFEAGRWPLSVYPGWLRLGLTFVVPIGFAVTAPAQALLSRLSTGSLLIEAVIATGMLMFTRWFLGVALRRYSGASA